MAGGVRVGKGTALAANEVIPQHITPPLPSGSQIPKKSDHQRVVEVENERVLTEKRKAQTAKDKAVGKRAAEGTSQRTKKKKTTPLSFALSDSEADESNRSGSGTHHSASPLNTIIPNEDELATSLLSEPVTQTKEGTDQPPLDNVEDTTEANSPQFENSPQYQQSDHSGEDTQTVRSGTERTHASGFAVSSTSGGSHRLAFPARHPGGDRAGSSLRRDAGAPELFVSTWNLTTHSILNDAEYCWDMMVNIVTPAVRSQQSRLSDYQALQRSWFKLGRGALAQIDIPRRYEALNEDYKELFESHRSCRAVHLGCVGKEADLVEKLAAMEKERDDLLDRDQERGAHPAVEGGSRLQDFLLDRDRRLIFSDEYRKSLSDVFNLAIAAGWSEGVKATCFEEEAQAFLATAVDYDPACKETFMSEFDSLFDKSYPYVEKFAESFRLPLEDLQNMWPEGTGPTLSGNAAGASTTADASNTAGKGSIYHGFFRLLWFAICLLPFCFLVIYVIGPSGFLQKSDVPGSGRHLAIGSWTHLEGLAFQWASLGHWLLDSSGMSCIPGSGHHLTIGSWDHMEKVLRSRVWALLGHWLLVLHPEHSCIPGNERSLGHWKIVPLPDLGGNLH
ncbi:hypothetical protein Tco_0851291 [Tanacetum coccineum]